MMVVSSISPIGMICSHYVPIHASRPDDLIPIPNNSYFTPPESLSSTSKNTGQTAFASHLSRSNSTSKLEKTHSVTVFLPSNAAFSASNSTIPASQLISDHVVAGTVSYLPDLKDGSVLTTQRGETLAVSIRSGRYYINGGLITQANLVLENGVAHVVNKVGLG